MNRITKFVILDILKNRIVLFYTLMLAVISWSVFGLEDSSTKGLLTLLNVILLTVPLVCIIFATIYMYNSSEFIELLLSQPIRRARIWRSLFSGLLISMLVAFLLGSGTAIAVLAPNMVGVMMIVVGCLVTAVFVSIAMLASALTRDKAKGIGIAIIIWLFYALLFDGLVLFLLIQFADYPIENAMVGITALNPIGLGRIMILLHLDVSAMLGYTGAIFKEFFGTTAGIIIAFAIMLLWVILPYSWAARRFRKSDL